VVQGVCGYAALMAVDLEAEGLLDGLRDPRERAERLALLQHLLHRGVALKDLRGAAAEGRLVLLAVEHALDATGQTYAPEDVAARTELDVEAVRRLRASFGLAVPAADEPGLGEPDVEEARRAQQALALGFTEEQLLRLNRDVGLAAAHMAAAMLQAAGDATLRPGEGEHELAHRLALAAAQLLPMAGSIASYAVQEHLRAQLGRTAITPAELRSGRRSDVREISVLFADLVGFTALGASSGPQRLGDVAERLAAIAAAVADPPVSLVKTLGDGVMLVAPDPAALLSAADALLTTADAQGAAFPQLRAGVAHGFALSRGGDWFGEPVNNASRICSVAPPGAILATTAVKDTCPSAHWTPAGARTPEGNPAPRASINGVSLSQRRRPALCNHAAAAPLGKRSPRRSCLTVACSGATGSPARRSSF
jgi:adenylate cyclase